MSWRFVVCKFEAGWKIRAGREDVELACRVMGRLGQPCSAEQEATVLAAVAQHLRSRLAAYPTTRQQDEDEAAKPETHRYDHILRVL
jgi:hypothetical protein